MKIGIEKTCSFSCWWGHDKSKTGPDLAVMLEKSSVSRMPQLCGLIIKKENKIV